MIIRTNSRIHVSEINSFPLSQAKYEELYNKHYFSVYSILLAHAHFFVSGNLQSSAFLHIISSLGFVISINETSYDPEVQHFIRRLGRRPTIHLFYGI